MFNFTVGIALLTLAAGSASALPLPQQGVYRGPAPSGPNNNNTFSTWLGRSDMWGLDFMADGDWYQIQGPTWILNPWQTWLAAKPGRRLILSVPMLPQTAGTTLEIGATGAYNSHFSTLAGNLISRGMGNTIIRPGWEFNGGWYRWAANGKQSSFIAYWRHIVNSMRYLSDGVTPRPGANFQFCWNPNHGYNQFPAEQAYPGDAYVDFIGSDVYDQSWAKNSSGQYYYPIPAGATAADIANRRQKVWTDDILNGNHGLVFWRNFCAAHNKPFVLPEWGCMRRTDGHGGGDNPAFITNMYNYMTTYSVGWAAYFDADNGVAASKLSPTTTLPDASARFRELFGGSSASLSETFEDSVADGWTPNPAARWSIVTDSGDKAYKFDFDWSNTSGNSFAGDTAWTDYSMTVDFKITDFQSYSETRLYFRYASSTNHYCLEARENGGSRRLVLVRTFNGTVTDLATYITPLAANTWYVVGITGNGSSISVTFNGTPAIQVTDASIPAGKIGVGGYKQDLLFDNVTVD